MATMIAELYKALLEAGSSEKTAQDAATAVADYEKHATTLEKEVGELRQDIKGRFTLLQWMIGFSLALNTAILLKLLAH